MRPIDADALRAEMYYEAFETDTEWQRWDGGCWIRYKMFERAVDAAPTIEIPQWIPCSERLPSDGEYVLVAEKWHGYVWMWRLQHIDDEPTWEVNGYNIDIDEAVAWMPLPKPYRKGECYETD